MTWITASEATQRWSLSHSTVRRAIREGRIKEDERRKSGGIWLVTVESMERLYGKEKKEE